MTEFFMPNGSPNMNDLVVTLGAIFSAIVMIRQKAKDEQLKARDETIEFLKSQIEYLKNENTQAHQQLLKKLEG